MLFNILAPGVMEQHITFGWTRKRANGGAWIFSFMYAPEKSVTGPSMFDPTQTIELEMSQLEFEVCVSLLGVNDEGQNIDGRNHDCGADFSAVFVCGR